MTGRLIALARWIQCQPWNRPGTDKTWVLDAMWNYLQFEREVRQAFVCDFETSWEDDEA